MHDPLTPVEKSEESSASKLRRQALARWENEGGAGQDPPQGGPAPQDVRLGDQPLSDADLVQLKIRVIALENLVITLLAHASDRQLELARDMAAFISPRPGYTPHRLTLHAAGEMRSLVERADQFR